MAKKLSTEEFIIKTISVHGNRYDYSRSKYIDCNQKIEIYCKEHGSFWQTPGAHCNGQGCKECGKNKNRKKFSKTLDQFISDAINIHGSKYNYSLAVYINTKTKIKIICPIHETFEQIPSSHLNGNGCSRCAAQAMHDLYVMPLDEFLERAKLAHGDKFNYSKVKYINSGSKIEIICKNHGSFLQVPWSHLKGNGCAKCQYENNSIIFTKTLQEFIDDSIVIHGNKYDYTKSIYIDDRTKVEIICKEHGSFWQIPSTHLQGGGCSKCSLRISYMEQNWLNSLSIPNDKEHRQVYFYINKKRMTADGFDQITNTIYEFYGDYWHGNPTKYKAEDMNTFSHKTYGQLYADTIAREQIIINAGYKLNTMWEADYKKLFITRGKNTGLKYSTIKGII